MKRNVRVREVAVLLGVSKSLLDKMRCYGEGPRYFKIGRSVIYDTDDLLAWRDERSVKPEKTESSR